LLSKGSRLRQPLNKDELVEAGDVEERRRVRGVDDLVAAEGKLPQEAVEVALRLRAQEELRLLDQEHEPTDAERAAGLERLDDGERRRRRRGPSLPERAPENLERPRRPGVIRLAVSEQRARPCGGRQEEDGRSRRRAIERVPLGRASERGLAPVDEPHVDRYRPVAARSSIGRSQRGGGRVERGADRGEQVRLAGVRLADERAH